MRLRKIATKRIPIIFAFYVIQILLGLVIFSDKLILLIAAFAPAIVSILYLYITFEFRKNPKGYSSKKLQVPFVFFGLVIALQITAFIIILFTLNLEYDLINTFIIFLELTLTSLMSFFFIPLAIYNEPSPKTIKASHTLRPVSIIVPAYNEEDHIEKTLESLVEADYTNKEVIIVDDGSTDNTYYIASKFTKKFPVHRYSVIRKQNGGKTSALNYGIRFAKGEIIVVIDADSVIDRNSLKEILGEFQDPTTVAVAGDCMVSNRHNFLTNCQALDYLVSINVYRRAFAMFGLVLIVPGPLGAFRRKTLIQRGLYDKDTLTEDFDVTLKLLRGGGAVPEINSTSYTVAPATIRDLYKQKSRWNQGAFETLLKHKDIMTTARYGMLGVFLYPIKLLSFIVLPFFNMIVIAFTLLAVINSMWNLAAILFGLFMYFYLLQTSAASFLRKEKDWGLVLYAPFMSLAYRQFMDFVVIKSLLTVVFKRCIRIIK